MGRVGHVDRADVALAIRRLLDEDHYRDAARRIAGEIAPDAPAGRGCNRARDPRPIPRTAETGLTDCVAVAPAS